MIIIAIKAVADNISVYVHNNQRNPELSSEFFDGIWNNTVLGNADHALQSNRML